MHRSTAVLALLLLSCSTPAQLNRQAIVESAIRYTKAQLPEALYDPAGALVFDEGETWRVTFEGPADSLGGGAVVWVSKKTGKAVKVLGLQ